MFVDGDFCALAALRAAILSRIDPVLAHDSCYLSCGRWRRPGAKKPGKTTSELRIGQIRGKKDPGKKVLNISIFCAPTEPKSVRPGGGPAAARRPEGRKSAKNGRFLTRLFLSSRVPPYQRLFNRLKGPEHRQAQPFGTTFLVNFDVIVLHS